MKLRLFYRVLRLDRWTHVRFTPLGRMLLAAMVAVGLFALNPRASLAWQLAIVLVVVLLAAMIHAPLFRPRLAVRRGLPRFATVGTPLRYALEVESRDVRPLRGLEVTDLVPALRPGAAELMALDEVPAGGRLRLRLGLSYMRFVRGLRLLEGARCHPATLPDIPPRGRVSVELELLPLRRGYVRLDGVRVARPDPCGVFRGQVRLSATDRLLVLPRRFPVSWDGAGGTLRRPRKGARRDRATGAGADFARLREYRPRDPLRHIHWRAWARLGEPVVKEFHEESPSRNALVLDTCAPPGCRRAVFETAVSVAASFVADAGWRAGRLDLLVAGEQTVHLGQGSEGEGVGRMLEALACVERAPPEQLAGLCDSVTARLSLFGACVLVLLDWDEARETLVRAVAAAGVRALVLVVADGAAGRLARGLPEGLGRVALHPVEPESAPEALAGLTRSPDPRPDPGPAPGRGAGAPGGHAHA